MIRLATHEDIPRILDLGEMFAAYAPYTVEYSRETTANVLSALVQTGAVIVDDRGETLAGALLGTLLPFWYAPSTVAAVELAWWVSPEHRGGRAAVGMARAFEQWGKDNGASVISLCDMCIDGAFPVGPLLSRMGYRVSERTHVKEI